MKRCVNCGIDKPNELTKCGGCDGDLLAILAFFKGKRIVDLEQYAEFVNERGFIPTREGLAEWNGRNNVSTNHVGYDDIYKYMEDIR